MTFPAGFFVIDKPSGVTSFAMVSLVRRLTGVRRVGHAGTLDPLATGVLPVAVGQAARLIEYMDESSKTYVARVRFGATTDTYDAEGAVTSEGDASGLTATGIEAALIRFTGDIEQLPPAYSAIKLAGKPLYRYARAGEAVDLKPRPVHIDRISLLNFGAPEAEIEVVCGKGTYIRSLAHDLGQLLGCGAHLAALRRTSSGGFAVVDAIPPDELMRLADAGALESALFAPDRVVERRRAAILDGQHVTDVREGRNLELSRVAGAPAVTPAEICRAYDADGSFLGMLRSLGDGRWHPAKVLANA